MSPFWDKVPLTKNFTGLWSGKDVAAVKAALSLYGLGFQFCAFEPFVLGQWLLKESVMGMSLYSDKRERTHPSRKERD